MTAPRDPALDRLQSLIGHRFESPEILRQALTHASMTSERIRSNERLEFLGDRVLGLVAAEMLYQRFPDEPEGDLGYRFTALARRETLVRVAQEIGLGEVIIMSDGERETGGAEKDGLLADACEALIAAMYLDGGLAPAAAFIERFWSPLLEEDPAPRKDAKTELQEWAQARGLALPRYDTLSREGPDHAPVFTGISSLADAPTETAEGPSKRAAEQAAAEQLLARLTGKDGTS